MASKFYQACQEVGMSVTDLSESDVLFFVLLKSKKAQALQLSIEMQLRENPSKRNDVSETLILDTVFFSAINKLIN